MILKPLNIRPLVDVVIFFPPTSHVPPHVHHFSIIIQLLSSPSPSTVWIISTAKERPWSKLTRVDGLQCQQPLRTRPPCARTPRTSCSAPGTRAGEARYGQHVHHGCHGHHGRHDHDHLLHDHDQALHVQHQAHVLGRRPLFKSAFNLFWKPVSDCSCLGGPCCRRGTVLDCNCKQKVLKSSDLFLPLFFNAKEILSFAGSQDM